MIVAGRVSQKMAPVLRQIYDQMPEPQVGAVDGRLRLQRRHVQQLRDRPGRRPRRARRHLPARLPAAAGDAASTRSSSCTSRSARAARRQPREGAPARPRPRRSTAKPTAQMKGLLGESDDILDRITTARGRRGRPATGAAGRPSRARRPVEVRHGMFGAHGTGDTSGYGGLVRPVAAPGRHGRGPTAAGSTRRPTASSRAGPGVRPGGREGRRRPRRDHLPRPPRAPGRVSCRRCATTPPCGSRCAWASPACTTRTRPAASCTPSTRCCR